MLTIRHTGVLTETQVETINQTNKMAPNSVQPDYAVFDSSWLQILIEK